MSNTPNDTLLETSIWNILNLGFRDSDGFVATIDSHIMTTLVRDIIRICRMGASYEDQRSRLRKVIDDALANNSDYRVNGYGLLNKLDEAVAHAATLAAQPQDPQVSDVVNPGCKLGRASRNALHLSISTAICNADPSMADFADVAAERVVKAIEGQILYPLRGNAPKDIVNAQMLHLREMIAQLWPEQNVYRDIITGELATMMLDVFESGRQLGKQEVGQTMKTALTNWAEGE